MKSPRCLPRSLPLWSAAFALLLGCAVAEQEPAQLDRGAAGEASTVLPERNSAVMLQGFHWESHEAAWWTVIEDLAPEIAEGGFDMVWLPPSGGAASDEGYLPHQYFLQSSQYGSETELRLAIAALHRKGVKAIADLVLNHRVGSTNWADFTNPDWGPESVCRNDEWEGAQGHWDSGDSYAAARDIDHEQRWVQDSIVGWLNWMKFDIGYDGWRYDYAKGFGGGYVGEYNRRTQPWFSVGEYWTDLRNPDDHRQQLCDWVDATGARSSAFDFTTKGLLQDAVARHSYFGLRDSSGRPSGLIGWWPGKAVTFLDNHDTGPSPGGGQNHWPFPSHGLLQGYAYLLTHPGLPSVYWPHYFDWGMGGELRELIRLRKAQGITSTSSVDIRAADDGRYAAVIDDKVAMKIGYGDWHPGAKWELALSGEGYAVWVRPGSGGGDEVPGEGEGEEEGGDTPTDCTLRTVVYIYMPTHEGQSIFIRGGHDSSLVADGLYVGMDEPIRYLNDLNPVTQGIKGRDTALDWADGSALDWTCSPGSCPWHEEQGLSYETHGYGLDPEQDKGQHWWKFDVAMCGQPGDWFEFKAFLEEGDWGYWEGNIDQQGAPYRSGNHWARKGYVTWVRFNDDGAEYLELD